MRLSRPALAAIGLAMLVARLGTGMVFLLWGMGLVTFYGAPRFESRFLPAAFAGAAVAFPSRNLRAVGEYLLYLGTAPALAFMGTAMWWGTAVDQGDRFRYPAELVEPVIAHWPILAGLALALPFSAWRAERLATSATLQAAGVMAIGTTLVHLVTALAWPPLLPAAFTEAISWGGVVAWLLPAAAAAMFLRGQMWPAILIASIIVVGWFPLASFQLDVFVGQGGLHLVQFLQTPLSALAVVLMTAAARAAALRRLALTHA